jgi:uncharacterized protein (DUF934 family)
MNTTHQTARTSTRNASINGAVAMRSNVRATPSPQRNDRFDNATNRSIDACATARVKMDRETWLAANKDKIDARYQQLASEGGQAIRDLMREAASTGSKLKSDMEGLELPAFDFASFMSGKIYAEAEKHWARTAEAQIWAETHITPTHEAAHA